MNELEILKVRDELLQAMFWMSAEGLAEAPRVRELSTFLVVPPDTLTAYLERFVADGYLTPDNGGYRLTPDGQEAGKRGFADEFSDLTRPTHGECDADCWCHESAEAAASCHQDRATAHAPH